ncbi:phage tail protein [Edaphocola aurantiacus]|uniref:phage tail protein n=1 Tax=Edaphocola aurantiacus TaxID=2601682 RepID=UPI001C969E9D|nr:tail fiber protein [Edaphocola aurantiacus]
MEGYIGEIRMWAGTRVPRDWAFCDGSLLNINNNQALFSVIGTTYGGNGQQNFALPDFRDRVGMGRSNATALGMVQGTPTVTLLSSNMPSFAAVGNVSGLTGSAQGTISGSSAASVSIPCSNTGGSTNNPSGNVPAVCNAVDSLGSDASLYSSTANSNMQAFNMNVPISINANLPVSFPSGTQLTLTVPGQSLPVNNIQPSLGINYIICVYGIYPDYP